MILKQFREDLKYDAGDPIVAGKMREHEQDLRQAVKIVRDTVPDLKENYSVPQGEVDKILALFGAIK
jgi:hypothetical protein